MIMMMVVRTMMTKSRPKKRNSGMSTIKTMIVSLSMAIILGFWGLFSRQNEPDMLADTGPADTQTLVVQPVSLSLAIDLPPLPTLIPPLDPTTMEQPAAIQTIQPQVLSTTKIFLGGAKPKSGGNSNSSGNSAAVTTTQSSK